MSAARIGSADLELTAEVHAQLIAAFQQISASVAEAIAILSGDAGGTRSVETVPTLHRPNPCDCGHVNAHDRSDFCPTLAEVDSAR